MYFKLYSVPQSPWISLTKLTHFPNSVDFSFYMNEIQSPLGKFLRNVRTESLHYKMKTRKSRYLY
jgi:hypothetical protein